MAQKIIIRISLLLIFTCGWFSKGFAQEEPPFEISQVENEDGSVSFLSSSKEPRTITYLSIFYSLGNTEASRIQKYSLKGSGEFLRLYPIDQTKKIIFKVAKTSFIPGKLDAVTDSNFVYRFPCSLKDSVKILLFRTLKKSLVKDTMETFPSGFVFKIKQGDTVFAARKGIVVKTQNKLLLSDDTNPQYALVIEHDDGTLATYFPIEEKLLMVKDGDIVFPGTPLARTGQPIKKRSGIALVISNPISNPSPTNNAKEIVIQKYIFPLFATSNGPMKLKRTLYYKPTCSEEMITAEMTPKQKVLYSKHKLK